MTDTLLEIRTEIEDRGFDYLSPTRIDNLVNYIYQDVCRRHPWPFLETTASGTAPLTVSDLGHVLSVVDTTADGVLRWEDKRSIRERDPGIDQTGTPDVWYHDAANNQIEVYPVNTTNTIVVDYVKVPTALSGDSDEPLIPSRFRYTLVEGAVARAYRDDDEIALAESAAQEYEAGIYQMADALLVPNYDSPADLARGPMGTSSTDW